MVDVAIVGSGFGGLGAAIRLRDRGVRDVTIFERADDLGGTWRDNVYPGCRVDVASDLYSFSFAPNPSWSNTYSYQHEIQQYLQNIAEVYQLRELIKFGHDVADISFDESFATVAPHHESGGVLRQVRHLGDRSVRPSSSCPTFRG